MTSSCLLVLYCLSYTGTSVSLNEFGNNSRDADVEYPVMHDRLLPLGGKLSNFPIRGYIFDGWEATSYLILYSNIGKVPAFLGDVRKQLYATPLQRMLSPTTNVTICLFSYLCIWICIPDTTLTSKLKATFWKLYFVPL